MTTRPPQPDARATVELPHKFTDAEIVELSKAQNACLREAGRLQAELSKLTKEYQAKMAAQMAKVGEIGKKLERGEEPRQVNVVVSFDPTNNRKTFWADESKTVCLGEAAMTKKDYELPLL